MHCHESCRTVCTVNSVCTLKGGRPNVRLIISSYVQDVIHTCFTSYYKSGSWRLWFTRLAGKKKALFWYLELAKFHFNRSWNPIIRLTTYKSQQLLGLKILAKSYIGGRHFILNCLDCNRWIPLPRLEEISLESEPKEPSLINYLSIHMI